MATLPKEQVTQRAARTLVTFDASPAKDATSEVVWEATTDGNDVVLVTSFDEADFGDRTEIDERLAADPTWEPA